jgi:KDO transferase-3
MVCRVRKKSLFSKRQTNKSPLNVSQYLNIMKKIASIYRRMVLGEKFKHQYNCHPKFNILRKANSCTVTWDNNTVAEVPFAHTLQGYFNKNCFIIASGPSLAEIDLTQISQYDTISLNCAIRKFTEINLKPTHCIIVDHRVFERQWGCVEASILSGANCFFSYEGLSRICEHNPSLLTHNNIYLIESASRKYGVARPSKAFCKDNFPLDSDFLIDASLTDFARSIGFSCNLEKGLFSGKTVATWAVQLAYCLGYRQLYIIGMDLGGTGKKHFYQDQNHPAPDFLKDYEPHIRACFELARQASKEKLFAIYNLSKDSTLPHEIIPKIDIKEALKLASTTN